MKSSTYALAGPDDIVIAKGSSKAMHRLRKQKGEGYRVWNAPSSKIGDKLK
jgi:hypothetical protein